MKAIALVVGLGMPLLVGCGGDAAPTSPTPSAPSQFTYTISGRVVDVLTGAPAGGVSIQLNYEKPVVSDGDGRFLGSVPGASEIRIIATNAGYVTRVTYVRVSDPPQTISLIPTSFNLTAFDEATARSGSLGLSRWVTAPALVVITRELQYVEAEDSMLVLDQDVGEFKVAALVADLRDGFFKMTDGRLGDFSSVTLESPVPGSRVLTYREGTIVVARAQGLVALARAGGATNALSRASVRVRARILLDSQEDNVGTVNPTYPSHTRKHEMGHAVGFYHVVYDSVMNIYDTHYIQPTAWDGQAARILYQRPPGNKSPDEDPHLD